MLPVLHFRVHYSVSHTGLMYNHLFRSPNTMPSKTAVCTIIAKNYLPFARVLMSSIRLWNPDFLQVVILVDRVDGFFDPKKEPFDLVLSEDLSLDNARWFHFKYTILELSTAVKPYALQYIFARYGVEKILYLDPDIKVYRTLEHLISMLDHHHIILTPHLLGPLEDDHRPSELDILRSGVYNLGFLGLANSSEVSGFLEWWKARLYEGCVVDLARGLFVDQRWVDLVPALFDGVGIIREPGYNVAYWNLNHRRIAREQHGYTVNGQPLQFFHYSGFDPANPEQFSRHQNRFRLSDLGDARSLVLDYRDDLYSYGYESCRTWPYAYGVFDNGVPIADMGRPIHLEEPDLLARVEDPFSDEGFRAFLSVWNAPIVVPAGQRSGITKLAYRIYRTRSDVQAAMPDIFGVDHVRFLKWLLSSGEHEHSLHELLVRPIAEAVEVLGARKGGIHPEDEPADLPKAPEECEPAGTGRWPANGSNSLGGDPNELIESGGPGLALSRLARRIYELRPDLQRFFPDPCGRDGVKYLLWFLTSGRREYQLEEVHLAPLRRQWDALLEKLSPMRRVWCQTVLFAASSAVLSRALTASLPLRRGVLTVGTRILYGRSPRPTQKPPRHEQPSILESAVASSSGSTLAPVGLNLVGYLHAETGVGESVRAAALAARAAGLPVRLSGIPPHSAYRNTDFRLGSADHSFPLPFSLFHVNADQTPGVFECVPRQLLAGKYRIGYWAWELEEFPVQWRSSFSYFNEIWVPSSFCQESISRKSPIPVIRVPHCVSVEAPADLGRGDFGLPDGKFIFLTVFDVLSVVSRKNPIAVVKAFIKAFAHNENCILVVKINNGAASPTQVASVTNACAGRNVMVIDRTFTRDGINALINCCDCLVSLHRSEGFGLVLAEAMDLGKPVICTGYSGNMDFTKADNAFLVDYRLVAVGSGCAPYPEDAVWADPSVEHASAQMQKVYGDSELRTRVACRGRDLIRANFSPVATGKIIADRLNQLASATSVKPANGQQMSGR